MNRRLKLAIWIVGSAVVLAGVGGMALYALASRAVSDYAAAITEQITIVSGNEQTPGQTTATSVKLKQVWLGSLVNPKYKKIDNLQTDYAAALTDLQNYNAVLQAHDGLVEQYNKGINGEPPTMVELRTQVITYRDALQQRFADETERLAAVDGLLEKINASTSFDAVSSDISTVLDAAADAPWFDGLVQDINKQFETLQQQINQ
jgi:hypothetical protein